MPHDIMEMWTLSLLVCPACRRFPPGVARAHRKFFYATSTLVLFRFNANVLATQFRFPSSSIPRLRRASLLVLTRPRLSSCSPSADVVRAGAAEPAWGGSASLAPLGAAHPDDPARAISSSSV